MDLNGLHGWESLLSHLLHQEKFAALSERVDLARQSATVFPTEENTFSAFALTPPEGVRVVILGQDPYHEVGQAHGLAFSVQKGVKIPPSLRNIYKERESDLGIPPADHGCLTDWARQGVLLLNTVLTVEEGKANSHAKYGWQWFTDGVISSLAELEQPIAFVLWGAQAWKKEPLTQSRFPRLVIQSPHPSPLSAYRGFFGSKPFSQVNQFLEVHGERAIDWANN
jgi:uracil-DNA glycosylase